MDIPTNAPTSYVNHGPVTQVDEQATSNNVPQGPITRSCAKKLQQEVNSLLAELKLHRNENCLLPKCCTLIVLRFTHEDMDNTQLEKGYVKSRMSYMKTNKVAVQAETGYMCETLSCAADASNSRASLYQSAMTRGA